MEYTDRTLEKIANGYYKIAEAALHSEDAVLRDAAIQGLEEIGSVGALVILEAHKEEIGWLADYLSRVIRDLKQAAQ